MGNKELLVYIAGTYAGKLREIDSGRLTFKYSSDYFGPPLSLSMPIDSVEYQDKVVRPYLMGLLPDSQSVRREIARRYDVSGDNPFALLSEIGLDCPGAIQIVKGDDKEMLLRSENLVPVSEKDIAKRLAILNASDEPSWVLESEHWSLGGAQNKIALRFTEGRWFRCEGAAATTHILKPGISRLELQALDEYACMKLAKAVGLPVAEVTYKLFEDEPAIVVERFDRSSTETGEILRLHQEDFCQALSVLPDKKYASDGGPSTSDVINLLKKTDQSEENIEQFLAYLFFNYLIGGSDAHAKNFSFVFDEKGKAFLAPLYDVASIFPYVESDRAVYRMAMNIGGENRFGKVGADAVVRLARTNDLDIGACVILFDRLASAILENLKMIDDDLSKIARGTELTQKLLPSIQQNVELTLNKLKAL